MNSWTDPKVIPLARAAWSVRLSLFSKIMTGLLYLHASMTISPLLARLNCVILYFSFAERYCKRAALAEDALYGNAAAHVVHDSLRECETEAGMAGVGVAAGTMRSQLISFNSLRSMPSQSTSGFESAKSLESSFLALALPRNQPRQYFLASVSRCFGSCSSSSFKRSPYFRIPPTVSGKSAN